MFFGVRWMQAEVLDKVVKKFEAFFPNCNGRMKNELCSPKG